MKTGVLLLNFGGPWTLDDVKPFLRRLFEDPEILPRLHPLSRKALAWWIATVKSRKSRAIYQSLGGGSSQLKWTEAQRDHLLRELKTQAPLTEWCIEIGMQSWTPSIFEAVTRLKTWGADRVIALPLFPQFSRTTTGSCARQVSEAFKRLDWHLPFGFIASWSNDPGFIELWRTYLTETLRLRPDAHVLFSAHSLPMSIVKSGDPYPLEINRSIEEIMKGRTEPWSLSFQSRNGPVPWLSPATEDELTRIARSGVRKVVLVPISFVSDHIETSYELDDLFTGHAKKMGITNVARVPTFNDDQRFGRVLSDLVLNYAAQQRPSDSTSL